MHRTEQAVHPLSGAARCTASTLVSRPPRTGVPSGRLGSPAIRFCRARQAASAIEFAFVAPILFLLLAGAVEVSREVNTARRLTTLASSAATMIASDANGNITSTDLHYAYDSAMITFPGVLGDAFAKGIAWNNDITISMAGVSFAPTVPSCIVLCTYKASVAWTGAAAKRTCGSNLTPASDASTPTPTTLPSDLYNPVPSPSGGNNPPPFAVVVDVTYTWTPMLFSRFFGPLTLSRSAYISPRYAKQVTYTKAQSDDGFGKAC